MRLIVTYPGGLRELTDKQHAAKLLRLTFARIDAGRKFDILVNGELLETVTLAGDEVLDFTTRDVAIPTALTQAGRLVVMFRARAGSIAGGLYGLRLLR